jgi:hypothetical protein
MLKALAVALTLSLKFMTTFELNGDICSCVHREVLVTVGAASPPLAVREKSSTARPSSAPVASTSVQRIQKLAPLLMLKPVMVELRELRFAPALPSSGPTGPVVFVD